MRIWTLLFAFALCTACTEPGGEFLIKADSVVAPAAWSGGAPLTVKVYGRIGPNLCWQFKEFRVESDGHSAKVAIIGERPESGRTCADAIAYMNGAELNIASPLFDPFRLHIVQPDFTVLSKVIRIE
jgi:hypothetical protein